MDKYDHKKIDKKWQERWKESGIYTTDEGGTKPKKYVLDMFPYPSGEGLHVGHPKGYIATDIYSRTKRMQGYNVLHPMGWDAFGLPAENYAIKNKIHPRIAVEKNIATFKEQLAHIGFDYDWNREINTTDPEYYKWTQWIFLQLFKKGLAFQSDEPINWCPSCMTGLANEDLDGDECERCNTKVEKKKLPQWVLKITDYADRMLTDLDSLDWPEHIKEAQRNWIGRSEGAEIDFSIKGSDESVAVFTTRPDTLFGATYLVLAPEHPIVEKLTDNISNKKEVEQYVKDTSKKSEIDRSAEGKEKTGVKLEGVTATNPANKEEVPVFVADYVLGGYGTGAIMAVPAHDERDFEFAKKFDLPIRSVVVPSTPTSAGALLELASNPGTFLFQLRDNNTRVLPDQISFFGGGIEKDDTSLNSALTRELQEELELDIDEFNIAATYTYKSQQSGEYVLIAHIKNIDNSNLVLHEGAEILKLTIDEAINHPKIDPDAKRLLENLSQSTYVDTMSGVLLDSVDFDGMPSKEAKEKITEYVGGRMKTSYKLRDWVFSRQRYWGEPIPIIHCEKCGAVPVKEEDLPVLLPEVKSYAPSGTGESPLANISEWVNTTCPECDGEGKRETNTMPQWAGSSWYYLRFMDPDNNAQMVSPEKEKYWSPVDVYVGGDHAVRHLIYARFWHKFLFDIDVVSTKEPFARLEFLGFILAEDGRKMSKRYGNVINPNEVIDQYGADAFRVYEMFMGPFENTVAWSTASINGTAKFIDRILRISDSVGEDVDELDTLLHQTIQKVGEDVESFKFNTAVSQLMILLNAFEKEGKIGKNQWESFLKILAPFAPHITEELWEQLGNTNSIHIEEWPKYDESKLVEETVTIAVQVNGKTRATINVAHDAEKEVVVSSAKESVAKWLNNGELKNEIVVPGRLVNFVVE